jgi:phosphoribosylformimino-5-aminoimidazole carboxamide ribonucleotide (ProFAR) isomerase
MGVVTGRALYQGTVDFKAAQSRADALAKED